MTRIPAGATVDVTRVIGFDVPVEITRGQNRGRTEVMFAECGTIKNARVNSRERSQQSAARKAIQETSQRAQQDLMQNNPSMKVFPGKEEVVIYTGRTEPSSS